MFKLTDLDLNKIGFNCQQPFNNKEVAKPSHTTVNEENRGKKKIKKGYVDPSLVWLKYERKGYRHLGKVMEPFKTDERFNAEMLCFLPTLVLASRQIGWRELDVLCCFFSLIQRGEVSLLTAEEVCERVEGLTLRGFERCVKKINAAFAEGFHFQVKKKRYYDPYHKTSWVSKYFLVARNHGWHARHGAYVPISRRFPNSTLAGLSGRNQWYWRKIERVLEQKYFGKHHKVVEFSRKQLWKRTGVPYRTFKYLLSLVSKTPGVVWFIGKRWNVEEKEGVRRGYWRWQLSHWSANPVKKSHRMICRRGGKEFIHEYYSLLVGRKAVSYEKWKKNHLTPEQELERAAKLLPEKRLFITSYRHQWGELEGTFEYWKEKAQSCPFVRNVFPKSYEKAVGMSLYIAPYEIWYTYPSFCSDPIFSPRPFFTPKELLEWIQETNYGGLAAWAMDKLTRWHGKEAA